MLHVFKYERLLCLVYSFWLQPQNLLLYSTYSNFIFEGNFVDSQLIWTVILYHTMRAWVAELQNSLLDNIAYIWIKRIDGEWRTSSSHYCLQSTIRERECPEILEVIQKLSKNMLLKTVWWLNRSLALILSLVWSLTSNSLPRDPGSIPGSGKSPGGRHGNPLQYSCLENPHRQEELREVTVHGVSKSWTWLVTKFSSLLWKFFTHW